MRLLVELGHHVFVGRHSLLQVLRLRLNLGDQHLRLVVLIRLGHASLYLDNLAHLLHPQLLDLAHRLLQLRLRLHHHCPRLRRNIALVRRCQQVGNLIAVGAHILQPDRDRNDLLHQLRFQPQRRQRRQQRVYKLAHLVALAHVAGPVADRHFKLPAMRKE